MNEIRKMFDAMNEKSNNQLEHLGGDDADEDNPLEENQPGVDFKKNPYVLIRYDDDNMLDYFNITKKIKSGHVKVCENQGQIGQIQVKYNGVWFTAQILDSQSKIFDVISIAESRE